MKPTLLRILVVLSGATSLVNAATTPAISPASLLAHAKQLASDDFEGRAPGTPGEEKTVAYLEGEFRRLGLAPGNPDGTYIQHVPMIGITSKTQSTFAAGGGEMTLQPITEYTAQSRRLVPRVEVKDSAIVFVGYGIVAPEFGWDDYKGVDVRGKTIVMLVGDPPVIDPATGQLDPRVFGGKAMTYYGRWTYKYEVASAKGAAGCLIVHETGPAGYPFAVLGTTWGREAFDLITPDRNADRVAVEGWVTMAAAQRLFAAAGQDYAALKAAAVRRDFKPMALKASASFVVENTTREVASKNVIARVEGADPGRRNEFVMYTAHWDHLGRNPKLSGDQIFNGADDNASGVAILLELAQAFAALPPRERPKRSVLFLSVTAEEMGLLGSRYYAENPLYPLNRTLADINMDGANYLGRTRDVIIVGSGASTLDDVAAAVAQAQGRYLRPDPTPEKGRYYRSDHFELAKLGVPSLYPKRGVDYAGQPAGWGEKFEAEFDLKDYHKVTDEVKPGWTFEGGALDTEFLFEIGRRVANADRWPEWRAGNEFKARRDAMLKAARR